MSAMKNAALPPSSNITTVDFRNKRKIPDCEPGLQIVKNAERIQERIRSGILTIFKYEAEMAKKREEFLENLRKGMCDIDGPHQDTIQTKYVRDKTGNSIDSGKLYDCYSRIHGKQAPLTNKERQILNIKSTKEVQDRALYFLQHSHFTVFTCPESDSFIEVFFTVEAGKVTKSDTFEWVRRKKGSGKLGRK